MTSKKTKTLTPTSTSVVAFKKLNLRHLDNLNCYQLNARSLQLLDDSQLSYADNSDMVKVVTQWREATELFGKAINQDRGQDITKAIKEADQLRNGDFSAFKRSLSAFETTKRPDEIAAYKVLYPIVKPFKDCNKLDYEKESFQLVKLLTALDNDNLSQHLETLSLTRLVTNLKDSQEAFEKVFANGSDKKSQNTHYDTKQIRQELLTHYQRLMRLLELMVEIRQEEVYSQIITLLNTPRQYYADYLAHHTKKKGNEVNTDDGKDDSTDKITNLADKVGI